jgi:hypothetical protein
MDTTDMFHVDLVESSPAPRDMPAGKWCRYVISNGRSRVVGRFRGTLAQTRRNAEQLVDSINERALSGRSVWAARPQGRKKPDRKPASAARV